jgi:hypothetical protein
MANRGFIEKYEIIKESALATKMIKKVQLAYSEEHAMNIITNAQSCEMVLVPTELTMLTNDDSVMFDIFIFDKVNNDDEEKYTLNSWQNSLAALRLIADNLNYKEDEDVLVESVHFGIYYDEDADFQRQNVVTMITAQLDLSFIVA